MLLLVYFVFSLLCLHSPTIVVLCYHLITEYFKEILLGEDHPCSLIIIGSLECSPSSMLYRMPGLRPGRMESYPRELQGSALCRLLLDTEPGASGC